MNENYYKTFVVENFIFENYAKKSLKYSLPEIVNKNIWGIREFFSQDLNRHSDYYLRAVA